MNKKTYIAPIAMVQTIECETMLEGSISKGGAFGDKASGNFSSDSKARQDAMSGKRDEAWGNLW